MRRLLGILPLVLVLLLGSSIAFAQDATPIVTGNSPTATDTITVGQPPEGVGFACGQLNVNVDYVLDSYASVNDYTNPRLNCSQNGNFLMAAGSCGTTAFIITLSVDVVTSKYVRLNVDMPCHANSAAGATKLDVTDITSECSFDQTSVDGHVMLAYFPAPGKDEVSTLFTCPGSDLGTPVASS